MRICSSVRDSAEVVNFMLQNYMQPSIQGVLTPNHQINLLSSRFGGMPYWDLKRPFPCNEQGEPLALIAQINCAELPDHDDLPLRGLLQFYCDESLDPRNSKVVYFGRMDPQIKAADIQAFIANTTQLNPHKEQQEHMIWGCMGLTFKETMSLPIHLDGDLSRNMLQDAAQSCLGLHLSDTELDDLKEDVLPQLPAEILATGSRRAPFSPVQMLGYPSQGNSFEPLDTVLLFQIGNFNIRTRSGKDVCGLNLGESGELYFAIDNCCLDDGDFNSAMMYHFNAQSNASALFQHQHIA